MTKFWDEDGLPLLVESRFGFTYGPAVVERMASDPKGGVWIRVMSRAPGGDFVDIRVTPQGTKIEVVA